MVTKNPAAVDVQKLLRDAEHAKARGAVGAASGKYLAVLAVEPNNSVARAALEALPKQTGPAARRGLRRRRHAGQGDSRVLFRPLRGF